MNRAEVGAPASDDHPLYYPFIFGAFFASAAIGFVVVLEITSFTLDISIVRHRISAEIDTFLESCLHRREHEP